MNLDRAASYQAIELHKKKHESHEDQSGHRTCETLSSYGHCPDPCGFRLDLSAVRCGYLLTVKLVYCPICELAASRSQWPALVYDSARSRLQDSLRRPRPIPFLRTAYLKHMPSAATL